MTASDPDPAAAPVPAAPGELLADLERRHDEVLVALGRLEAQVEQVLVEWTRREGTAEGPAASADGTVPAKKPLPGRAPAGGGATQPRGAPRRSRSA